MRLVYIYHSGFVVEAEGFSILIATSERTKAFSKRISDPSKPGFLTNVDNSVSWTHENLRKTHALARLPDFSGRFAIGRKSFPQSESRESARFPGTFITKNAWPNPSSAICGHTPFSSSLGDNRRFSYTPVKFQRFRL